MSKPTPPCKPDCPRRSIVCHDPEVCEEWGIYQKELAEFHKVRKTEIAKGDNWTSAAIRGKDAARALRQKRERG